ncbi:iron chelate uptake ABC transporter family permease subunit (plasmid) [Paracoccus kondratievae]|uniref:iron ABC transporter permease n=1 Tax=Paracoccus kondratievae TaxID=135740 RepID=UPI0012661637|nr:iron ABC transporter permease [Paracoccus kondratievae]QFQ89590.1 iron chelate uptake ABC transporter family permease subunit [Paracoccus kondratievae]
MTRGTLFLAMLAAGLAILAIGLAIFNLTVPEPTIASLPDEFWQIWRAESLIPRLWMALISGAALGLSGLMFQQVLRNPLAEPATLGVLSGAQLAIALCVLLAGNSAWLREAAGLAGGLAALAFVTLLAGRRASGPALLVAGLVVNLAVGAIFVLLALFQHDYLRSVFIWASGNLTQNGTADLAALGGRLLVLVPIALILMRGMALFAVSDESLRGLGANASRLRLGFSFWPRLYLPWSLPGSASSGSSGLPLRCWSQEWASAACPAGLVATPAAGAVTLLLPTGVLTPIPCGLLLLLLLWQRRIPEHPARQVLAGNRRPFPAVLVALTVLAISVAFSLSETLHLPGLDAAELWPGRWPRVLTALSAGVMLALAGVVIQSLTGNPLASPESLGISSGAGLGIILGLLAGGMAALFSGAVSGALLAFALVVAISARNRFAPGALLLTGVAFGTFAGALISVIIASGDPRAFVVLTWSMGPTYRAEPMAALTGAAVTLLACLSFPLFLRWLRILPLGTAQAQALGVRPVITRFTLMAWVAVLTGVSTLAVGPISFAGLMAPHLARALGASGPGMQGICAAALGATILVLADLAGRLIWFPYEIPAGALASLLGAPFFLWLIGRGR